jgi:NAD-dependent oxidoreductase involved in siderophore biosynthesis
MTLFNGLGEQEGDASLYTPFGAFLWTFEPVFGPQRQAHGLIANLYDL